MNKFNDAYKTRLDGFGTNAKRMFTDIKNKALEMDTYINDEQIGSLALYFSGLEPPEWSYFHLLKVKIW